MHQQLAAEPCCGITLEVTFPGRLKGGKTRPPRPRELATPKEAEGEGESGAGHVVLGSPEVRSPG